MVPLAAMLALVLIAILVVIPFPTSYGFNDAVVYGGGPSTGLQGSGAVRLCPSGAEARVSYVASAGLSVYVNLVNPGGITFWNSTAAQNSTTFAVECGTYLVNWGGSGSGSLHVSGVVSYSAPVL
ncbi:MAG: hypothetical protein WBF81_07075 [Thermoplasmata archaeon]